MSDLHKARDAFGTGGANDIGPGIAKAMAHGLAVTMATIAHAWSPTAGYTNAKGPRSPTIPHIDNPSIEVDAMLHVRAADILIYPEISWKIFVDHDVAFTKDHGRSVFSSLGLGLCILDL